MPCFILGFPILQILGTTLGLSQKIEKQLQIFEYLVVSLSFPRPWESMPDNPHPPCPEHFTKDRTECMVSVINTVEKTKQEYASRHFCPVCALMFRQFEILSDM